MDTKALHEGYLLKNSEYRIISLLGQGGFGITYLAEQLSLSRKVAIKEFFMKENCNRDENTSEVSVPSVGSRELVAKFRQKFLREARMIAKLDNPHIVKIHDVFEENGTAYYVMEYLDGGSLVDEVKHRGPMSEQKALGYIRQVASALDYLHGMNVLHFDIKPANILIGNAGQAMLIDFGISKHYDAGGSQTSSTPVGISKGYAPLEQYQQGEISTFTPATDIYALGATLYYLLLGQTPPSASEVNEEGLGILPAHLSASVRKAIEKAMSPRRKDRPQSVKSFLSLLDGGRPAASEVPAADEETQVEFAVESPSASPSVPCRKSRWLLWLTLCLLVFLGGAYAVWYFMALEESLPSTDVVISGGGTSSPVASPVQLGSLKVSSMPSGALIWVDGKNTGKTTPEVLEDLSVGKHTVLLKLTGYQEAGKFVAVASSQRGDCHVDLVKEPEVVRTGTLKVSSTPSGASIWLDGKDTGKTTPEILENIAVGSHKIVLKQSGYKNFIKEINVLPDNREELVATLIKLLTKQDFVETAFDINMKMVYVKGGTFMMGATSEQGSDAYISSDEKPVHKVALSDYYIGAFEVTQGQWEKVMGTTVVQQRDKAAKKYKNEEFPLGGVGENYPMVYITYQEALMFCKKLSDKTGKRYGLPTEAQWEYAARGGVKSKGYKYSGSNLLDDVAWYWENTRDRGYSLSIVGRKLANELGIYDMSGNVWEKCRDWFASYSEAFQTNPVVTEGNLGEVQRGGSAQYGEEHCRVCKRSFHSSIYRYDDTGFRVVVLP